MVYAHQNKVTLNHDAKRFKIRPQIRQMTATTGSSHLFHTKSVSLSSKFPEMYPDSWIYRGFKSCNFDIWWKQNGGYYNDLRKKTFYGFQVDYLCQDGFNSENLPNGFVMQRQILINVIIFVAYVLNLCRETHKGPIIAQNALENGAWFWLMTDARYIALPLISRYHCLDPTNRDISRVHCSLLTDCTTPLTEPMMTYHR